MAKITWATDLHLNFATEKSWEDFASAAEATRSDCMLIGGDVSEAEDCFWHLQRLSERVQIPLYFILGNHDFYHSSFAAVRATARSLSSSDDRLEYLTGASPIMVDDGVALIGDDAPADARCGNVQASPVRLSDFTLTEEYIGLSGRDLWDALHHEGTLACQRLQRQLAECEDARQIIILTHAPVLREACWHEGRISDDDWAPFFVCQAIGDFLTSWCRTHPKINVTVLSGHTHGHGRSRLLPNLRTWTAAAEYGKPAVSAVFETATLTSAVDESLDLDLC